MGNTRPVTNNRKINGVRCLTCVIITHKITRENRILCLLRLDCNGICNCPTGFCANRACTCQIPHMERGIVEYRLKEQMTVDCIRTSYIRSQLRTWNRLCGTKKISILYNMAIRACSLKIQDSAKRNVCHVMDLVLTSIIVQLKRSGAGELVGRIVPFSIQPKCRSLFNSNSSRWQGCLDHHALLHSCRPCVRCRRSNIKSTCACLLDSASSRLASARPGKRLAFCNINS